MIARNIAPGLFRHFRIEELPFYDSEMFQTVRDTARSKIYPSGKYHINASDIDPEMIQVAKGNAKRAGVLDDINFGVCDYITSPPLEGIIICNPPYGNRLQTNQIDTIYNKLITQV